MGIMVNILGVSMYTFYGNYYVYLCVYIVMGDYLCLFLIKCVKLWVYILALCLKCAKRLIKYLSS